MCLYFYTAGILRQSLSIVSISGELFCLPEMASWEFFQWCCSKNNNWKRQKPIPWVCVDTKLPHEILVWKTSRAYICQYLIYCLAGVGSSLPLSLLASELFPALIRWPVVDICCQLNIVNSLGEIFPCVLGAVRLAGHVSLWFGITGLFLSTYHLLWECNSKWTERGFRRKSDLLIS